jgi:hypothetical protein
MTNGTIRLTLRTLLAWIDGVLPPEEHRLIGDRVACNRFATRLSERIRETAAHGAADLPSMGVGRIADDPNIVAEYLDNTLTSDYLKAFEMNCLGSTSHLAEVVSCHRMLAELFLRPELGRVLNDEQRLSIRERLGRLLMWVRAWRDGDSAHEASPAATGRESNLRDSQETARALVTAMVLDAGAHGTSASPAADWKSVAIDALVSNGFLRAPDREAAESVASAATPPGPTTPHTPLFMSSWVAWLSAGIALTLLLALGGALTSIGKTRGFRPEPGCFHCTEP